MKKILIALAFPFFGFSQFSITATGSYSQDFNTLLNSGTTNPWVDNSTILNCYAQRSGTGTNYAGDNGAGNTGNLYSYGTTAASERALGSLGSSNAAAGNFAYGIQFQNNTTGIVNNFTVSYTMEQWRKSGVVAGQTLTFWYKVSGSAITALNPNSNATWTQVTALTATTPINTATAAALDGNLTANQVVFTNIVIPGLSLNQGEYLMLKWDDPDHAGSDNGISIDDVTISWATSCNSTNTISEIACGSYTVPSGHETYNASGTYLDTIPNANVHARQLTFP